MTKHKSFSIRARLLILVLAAICFAQLLGLGIAIVQEARRYAESKRDLMFSTAQVIAAAAARVAAQNEVASTYQVLNAMGRIERIVYAAIERNDGSTLAELGAAEQLASDLVLEKPDQKFEVTALWRARSLEVQVPVVHGGTHVGTMRLIADTQDLPGRIMATLTQRAIGGIGTLALALLVAWQMQRGITRPLLDLTQAMSRVRGHHDYTVALQSERDDEVGLLVEGFNGMIADIRERDGRLTRHRERLEQDVAERTADFERAAAEARAADRAKSDFLATMSHEIRTPMNGILVMAELLAHAEMPARARRQAEVIARSGASLLAIINDILDLSKIEAGKLDVELLVVDPVEAVDTVLKLFADRAGAKGLDLAASVAMPRAMRVDADPTRLGQVLGNLVNNALKFTQEGGVCVHIAAEGAARVRFTVADTGIGIAEDKLGTIFEAFSQADQSTTRQFGGTGLGLTIARRLVTAMGGTLEVTSKLGQGTQFFFSLPARIDADTAAWASWTKALVQPLRAVVALEGAQSRQALAAALSAAGYAVAFAEGEALAELALGASLVVAAPERLIASPRLPVMRHGAILALVAPKDDATALEASNRIDATLGWPFSRLELDTLILRQIEGKPLADARPSTGVAQAVAVFQGLRVLVADDSEVNREVADAALQRLGIKADFVENGRQALEAALARRYDLVLMDGSMPEMDGFEATRALREREAAEARTRTPVIALTAHVVGKAADAWREAGMEGVLHKPFTLARLAEVIESHAGVARQVTMAEAAKPEPSSEGALDHALLNDLFAMAGGATAVVEKIIGLYRIQAQERVDAIRAAIAAQDSEGVAKAAHALKSMSFNVGARRVAHGAGEIERAVRIEERAVTEQEADALATELGVVLEELALWRPAVPAAA